MSFTFGQHDLTVTLVPERPRPGAKPMERRVYHRFGRVKERLVQELCDMFGGDVVYLEFKTEEHGLTVTVPIHSWRNPEYLSQASSLGNGVIATAGDLLWKLTDRSIPVVAYGENRQRWTVTIEDSASNGHDALDAEPDSTCTVTMPRGPTSNTVREEF